MYLTKKPPDKNHFCLILEGKTGNRVSDRNYLIGRRGPEPRHPYPPTGGGGGLENYFLVSTVGYSKNDKKWKDLMLKKEA